RHQFRLGGQSARQRDQRGDAHPLAQRELPAGPRADDADVARMALLDGNRDLRLSIEFVQTLVENVAQLRDRHPFGLDVLVNAVDTDRAVRENGNDLIDLLLPDGADLQDIVYADDVVRR